MGRPTVALVSNDSGTPPQAAIPYSLDEGEGEVIRWFGDTVTVKAAGPAFDVAIITAVAGSEPPLHLHADDDEALYVLEGALTVFAGDEVLAARAGSFVFLPRALPHTFAVDSGSVRLLTVLGPTQLAMYSDAEERFGARGMPARPRAVDVAVVEPALAAHGVSLVAPNPRHVHARRKEGST